MSLQAMKRKSNTLYRNMSSNRVGGFSLNGTRRNQGYIGQQAGLTRHLANTPMRGTVARGSGGCCGTYNRTKIAQNGLLNFNDTTVVKSSVLESYGRIRERYRWVWRPQPYSTVKPTAGLNIATQSEHTNKKATTLLAALALCQKIKQCTGLSNTCGGLTIPQRPRSSLRTQPRRTSVITKDQSTFVASSQSDYLYRLKGGCRNYDEFFIKNATNNAALPGPAASY